MFISHKKAFRSNVFNIRDYKEIKQTEVFVDISEMFSFFELVESNYSLYNFKDQEIFWYEDLRDDFDGTMYRMQEFLGVSPFNLRPLYKKIEQRNMSEVITNYSEVYSSLFNTKWFYR